MNAALGLEVAVLFSAAAVYYLRWMTVERFMEVLPKVVALVGGVGLAAAVAMVMLFKFLSFRRRANLALFIATVVGGLYLAEGMVRLIDPLIVRQDHVKELRELREKEGLVVPRAELVSRLRQQGHEVISVGQIPFKKRDNGEVIPILNFQGGATFIAMGFPVHTDEYGFRNSSGRHREGLDAVLVGDSFVFGGEVEDKDTIPSKLREQGLEVLGLGRGGNGPLRELATLMEYASPLKPKTVFWLYHEGNDLRGDLQREMNSGLYGGYLSGQRHGLRAMQSEINEYYASKQVPVIYNKYKYKIKYIYNFFPDPLTLTRLRKDVKNILWALFWHLRDPEKAVPEKSLLKFREILTVAKSEVESWGGAFCFVYLPGWQKYYLKKDDNYFSRGAVLDLVESLNIQIVDMHEVFVNTPDPLDLFPFRLRAHYTPVGYALVADEIARVLLKIRGAPPPPPMHWLPIEIARVLQTLPRMETR